MDTKKDNDEIDALKEDINRLREDIANLASALPGAAGDTVDDARDKVSGKAREAGDEFRGKMREGLERGKQFMDDLDARVARNPVGSVLVAFGAGLLIAKLLGSGDRH